MQTCFSVARSGHLLNSSWTSVHKENAMLNTMPLEICSWPCQINSSSKCEDISVFQASRVKFRFEPDALEVVLGEKENKSENKFVGGENRWKYSTFTNWEVSNSSILQRKLFCSKFQPWKFRITQELSGTLPGTNHSHGNPLKID